MSETVLPDNRELVFGELIDSHLPMMRRVVFRILGNTGDTDDVIQQALLKAWTKFDRCEKPEKISGWVCRIACNEAYDLLRRRKREVAIFENRLAADVPAPGHSLPEYLHSALNLTIFEGLSTNEAAEVLGCGPATLYWRVHKARKVLGKQLKELLK